MEPAEPWREGIYPVISSLSVGHVRSLDGQEFSFTPGINVIYGPNGCGKTTVLESVHLLSQGFSFRAKDLKELVTWNADELVLRGTFEYDNMPLSRALLVGRRKIAAKENGVAVRSASAFFGKSPAVIMQPSDIELLRGAPEIRRHWLDEILCFRSATNAGVLRNYKRVLQQRNQWLRQFKREGSAVGGEDLFQILSQQLVELGAKLWLARINLSAEISPVITGYYRRLSGGIDEITCDYRSSILKELDALDAADFMGTDEIESMVAERTVEYGMGGVTEEMLRNAFTEKLSDLELVEKMQGVTMAGPHRDDLALCASGYEMRSVGSQGQCRSAAIAMRFAAVDVASQHVGKPILLLDDIFAELDVNRRDAVASLVREKDCQVLIATPQVEELPFKADKEIPLGA